MKKFIPILYQTPMVQALQEDHKTMTRRTKCLERINKYPDEWVYVGFVGGDGLGIKNGLPASIHRFSRKSDSNILEINCPYGKKGDVLWVRETFFIHERDTLHHYKADYTDGIKRTWKPGIHMPMTACRLFLEVIDVRVERLHQITNVEAVAEGIYREWDGTHYWYQDYTSKRVLTKDPVESFRTLWWVINGKENYHANPFVWVVSFKKIDKPDDWNEYIVMKLHKKLSKFGRTSPINDEKGELNIGEVNSGVMFEGRFYKFGSIEYKNLMLIEGSKEKNKNTLLGLVSQTEKSSGNLTDKN